MNPVEYDVLVRSHILRSLGSTIPCIECENFLRWRQNALPAKDGSRRMCECFFECGLTGTKLVNLGSRG